MSLTTNRYRLLQISRFEVLKGRESDAPTIRPLFLNRRMVLAHGRKLTFSMTVALLTVGDQEFTSARMMVTPNVFHQYCDAIGISKTL